MEKVELPIHEHPLLLVTRFDLSDECSGCRFPGYIYGGYRCNELGCGAVFQKECAESLPEIYHSSHPDHLLKFNIRLGNSCSLCGQYSTVGYSCSICGFMLDLGCVMRPTPLLIEKPSAHEHVLELSRGTKFDSVMSRTLCIVCKSGDFYCNPYCMCFQCKLVFHVDCVKYFPEAYHTSHPQHPLKLLVDQVPDYADKKCLLCGLDFGFSHCQLHHHCDVCNFSICRDCLGNPPPLAVVSLTTHEHQLHLVPRRIEFTCNACGTLGDRSPYFCLPCNIMIHWECIDLPRIININRHDHRISYTHRLGHGNWKCGVCRKKVDGFYGAYSCTKCSNYVVHSRCARRNDIWDMVEQEGTPEEEEIAPFEVIDDNTIKHFSHDHNLHISKDGMILHESIVCAACVLQILSEPFYTCKQCDFILHEKCANLPRKKRNVCDNQPFTLHTDSRHNISPCYLCFKLFSGFRYQTNKLSPDIRCSSISEPFVHGSHPHPLYYAIDKYRNCSECGKMGAFGCDECDYILDYQCALLPQKVMRLRYDDHPLYLSYGENSVDSEYWCEACETKLNPKKWFYTCNDCGVTLHISCVVGDFSYVMPGPCYITGRHREVVPNTSVCRKLCAVCNNRCKLPSILKGSKAGADAFFCSLRCDEIPR